jgi:hypothetical protein
MGGRVTAVTYCNTQTQGPNPTSGAAQDLLRDPSILWAARSAARGDNAAVLCVPHRDRPRSAAPEPGTFERPRAPGLSRAPQARAGDLDPELRPFTPALVQGCQGAPSAGSDSPMAVL